MALGAVPVAFVHVHGRFYVSVSEHSSGEDVFDNLKEAREDGTAMDSIWRRSAPQRHY
jgi:hypothetical protein